MSSTWTVVAATVIRVPGPATPAHTVVAVVEEGNGAASTRTVGVVTGTGEGEAATAPAIGTRVEPVHQTGGEVPVWRCVA